MMKSIKINEPSWHSIITEIQKEYPKSIWLSRDKMRRVLGFVPREHEEWHTVNSKDIRSKGWERRYPTTTIYLDFYDEHKKTIFILKYSKYLTLTGT
jgi:hypothetical protein